MISSPANHNPVWLAVKAAPAAGKVEVVAPELARHGRARPADRRDASRSAVDGVVAAFRAGLGNGPAAVGVAAAIAPRFPGITEPGLEDLAAQSLPAPLFP